MMNSILGGRNSKNRQMPDVVPETPEGSSNRSRRTSTLNSSAATRSFLMQSSKTDQTPGSRGSKTELTRVEQTPDNTVQFAHHKTMIAETPDDTVLDATKVSDVENRAASLGIFSESPSLLSPPKAKVKHGPKMRQLPSLLPTEESFILSTQQQVNSTFVAGQKDADVVNSTFVAAQRDASLDSTYASSTLAVHTPEREVKSPIINVSSSSRRKKGRPVKISREVSPNKEKQVSRDESSSRQISPTKENLEVEKHKNRLKTVETSSFSLSKEKDILDILDAESALVSANEKEMEIEKHKHRLGLVENKGKDENKPEDLSVASEKKRKTAKEKESNLSASESKDTESEIEKHRKRLKLAESLLPSPSREKEPKVVQPKTPSQPSRPTEAEIEKHRNRLKLAESSLASQSKEKELEIESHKKCLKLAESKVASKNKDKDLEIEKHKTSLKLAQSNLASMSREKQIEIEKHRNRLELAELSKAMAGRSGNNLEVDKQVQRKASPSRAEIQRKESPSRAEMQRKESPSRAEMQRKASPSRAAEIQRKASPSRAVNELEVEKHRHRLQLAGSSRASPSREKVDPPRKEKNEAPPNKEKTDADVEKHRNRLKSAESSRASFGLGEKVIVPKENEKNNMTLDLSEKSTNRASLRLLQEKPFSPSQDSCDEGLDLSKAGLSTPVSDKSVSKSLQHPGLPHGKASLGPVYECENDSYESIGLNLSGTGQTSPEKPNGKIHQPVNYKLPTKSASTSKSAKSSATPKSTATPKSAARNKKEDNRRSRRSNVNKDDFLNFLFQKEKSPDRNAQALRKDIPSPVSDNIFAKNGSDSDSEGEDGWEAMMSSDGSSKKYLPIIDPSRKSVVISGNIKSKTKEKLEKPSANALASKPSRKNLIDDFGKNPGKNSPKHGGGKAVRVVNEKAKENIYELDGMGEVEEEKSVSEENEKSLFNVDDSNVTLSRRRSQKVQPQTKSKLSSISETDSSSLSKVLNVSTSSQNISSCTRTGSSKTLGNISSASSSTSTLYPRGGAKPLSFQDFSTDSAKVLIGMFEKGEYPSDGEDKTSTTDKVATEKQAKENCGNISKVAEKTNSLKRKSTSLVETPVSKRSRNLLQVPGAGIPDSPSSVKSSSAVKATPKRSKQAALRDKTSLSPIPMELCESPNIRRSGRASTQISTVASDSLSKRSLSPLAAGGKLRVSPEATLSETPTPKTKSKTSDINDTPKAKSKSTSDTIETPKAKSKSTSDIIETPKARLSEKVWKPPASTKDSETSGKATTIKSNLTAKGKASDGPKLSGILGKGVNADATESPSLAPTQPPPTFTPPVPKFVNPPAQQASPSETLKGKVVYVEYYADNENRSKVLKQICRDLGAEVVDKMSSNVTHFVFKDGNPANYMKAKKFGIHIVSATWVEACKKEVKVVAEDLYPSISIEKYDSPGLFAKLKKGKSMQVRDLEEDVERARIAQERKAKTLERKQKKEKEEAELKKKSFNVKMPTHEHYYKANGRVAKNKALESSGLQEVLAEFQSPSGSPLKLQRIADTSFSPKNPSDDDFDTPLAKRIAAKYRSPAIQISGCEDTPSSSSKPLAKPLLGESPLTLATPNPGDKKKSINRRALTLDDSSEEKKKPAANKSKEEQSQLKSPATEPRRRSGRASTQIATAATTSVCNQKEQTKTSPGLDPQSPALLSSKHSEASSVPSEKDSSFLSIPSKKSLNEVDSSQDKAPDESILDETDYGSPILESTRAEPRTKKSTVKSSKSLKAPNTTPKGKYLPTKNAKKNVESELLFDSLLQGKAVEKDKSTEPPAESERLFDSLLQSSSTTEKKPASKSRRDRSLLPFPSTATNEVTPSSKKSPTKSPKTSNKPPEVKIPEKSPEQSSLSMNKSPRLVAPWRHLEELNNEEPEAGNDDVYEFTGFGDEPPPSNEEMPAVKPRKKAGTKPPLPATISPPIGRPSTNRMFSIGLPARKRKLDESPSKSQSGIGSAKEKSEVCPAIQKTTATPVTPTEVLDASPNLSTVENATTITSEGVFVTEHQNTTKKHVLLSKIFSKPPAKETDPKQINSESEEELKISTKKHKLFNQKEDILDQTASPSAVRDTQHIPNVHTGEPNTATQSKTVIVKSKDKDAVFAHPPKSSSFKKPKKQKLKVTKRKARSSSSESSEQSDSDSASSEGTGFSQNSQQSSQGSKNNSQVKKLKPPRRSSLEFQPLPKFARKLTEKSSCDEEGISQSLEGSSQRGGRRGRKVSPTNNIVCTSCHKDDISLVKELIKKFGKFSFSDSVNINTSHVISGEGKRTLNLLKGLLQGCWLVTKEWVLASLEEGKWTDEEPYEMVDFSPAVRSVRLDRAAFEGAFKSDLFKDCGVVYVSTNCRAPREELKQLIISGGGSVANLVKVSDIIVGEDRSDITTCCVTEKWILDSIQFHVIMPFADYTYLPKESE